MNESVERLANGLMSADEAVDLEFEARLADSSLLAFRVAFSVLRHRQDAEDVAQDAFVRAHRSFRKLRDRNKFRAWLVRMTWRLALDRKRGDRRRAARETLAMAPLMQRAPPTTEQSLIEQERSQRLWTAIDRLPDKLRIVLVLAVFDDYGIGEIATLLGIPDGTVKSRLHAARQKLEELLR